MGRASGNGMSGALIYAPQDWSCWLPLMELREAAKQAKVEYVVREEIQAHINEYRERGTLNTKRVNELVATVNARIKAQVDARFADERRFRQRRQEALERFNREEAAKRSGKRA